MAKVTRREFLKTVVVSAGALGVGGPTLFACGSPRAVEEVFPQSIASGDPRSDSIVLWTRALGIDPDRDTEVSLELATDEAFSSAVTLSTSELSAPVDHDHCLRIKVTDLSADTTYFYRFAHAGTFSRTGRFRTAPAATSDISVRFAVASCQDFVGRYYNSLLRVLEPEQNDLAFVLHLGDYVYETTGDPGFMMAGDARAVAFRTPDDAIALTSGDRSFHAARSVDNYRDLYRTFRSDPILQQVHERFAFVCVWDDHEFSDDSWQDNGTYSDGALDEQDADRRRNAEQAYFEYMPIALDDETSGGALERLSAQLFPNTRLFRSLRFGRHLMLALTDYRSFRPDHPIAEHAFPGTVVMSEQDVMDTLARLEADGDLPGTTAADAFATGGFRTYVAFGDAAFADHRRALELVLAASYREAGVPDARADALALEVAGSQYLDAAIVQQTLEAGRASLPADLMSLSPIDPSTGPRGLSIAMFGKTSLVGQLGSRYLVVKRAYDLYHAFHRRLRSNTSMDDALGTEQETWLRETLAGSDATWNVVGNSVCNTSLILDLSPFAGALPEGLPPERFYLNVDHWDGFPERRRALMNEVYRPANAVLLAGDIHGAFLTDFGADTSGNRVIEITTSSISSSTFNDLLLRTGSSVASIRDSGLLEPVLSGLDIFMKQAFPQLLLAQSNMNGISFVTIDGTSLNVEVHLVAPELVTQRFYDRPGELVVEIHRYSAAKDALGPTGPLTLVPA